MRCLYAILAALVVVLLAVPAPASPACQPGTCQTPAVVHQQAIAVARVAAVFPLYGAGYVGTGYGGDDETKELLRELLKEMRAMRQDLAAQQPAGTLDLKAGPDVFAVLKASCVSCHGGEKPKGDFALVNDRGEFLRLSPADRRSVLNRIDGKGGPAMPPAGHKPLTAAEKATIKAALADRPPGIPAGKK